MLGLRPTTGVGMEDQLFILAAKERNKYEKGKREENRREGKGREGNKTERE
jgi:hypothetical protein